MPSNPLVSVIIIFLNAADFLKEAVESVLDQTYPQWELLLIDDGSSDSSSETAISYAARLPNRIFYLEHEQHQNMGMSASRNLGIHHSKGSYIAFLDADDYWLPMKLETHVRILETHSSAGMLFGTTKYWFSWTGRPEDRDRDYVPARRVRTTTVFDPPELLPLFLEGKVEIPSPCSLLVRRDAVIQAGGFEDSFRGMYEDQAFYTKMSIIAPIVATDDCLAWYRQHPKSHVSIANQTDRSYSRHFSFLKWVESFCHSQHLTNQKIDLAIRRQLWLYNMEHPRILRRLVPKRLRWIKKWLLRLEEYLLPFRIRNWLWSGPPR